MPAGATGTFGNLTVRGIEKVRAVVLWFALTNNILQGTASAGHKRELIDKLKHCLCPPSSRFLAQKAPQRQKRHKLSVRRPRTLRGRTRRVVSEIACTRKLEAYTASSIAAAPTRDENL